MAAGLRVFADQDQLGLNISLLGCHDQQIGRRGGDLLRCALTDEAIRNTRLFSISIADDLAAERGARISNAVICPFRKEFHTLNISSTGLPPVLEPISNYESAKISYQNGKIAQTQLNVYAYNAATAQSNQEGRITEIRPSLFGVWVKVWVRILTHILTHTISSKNRTKSPENKRFQAIFGAATRI